MNYKNTEKLFFKKYVCKVAIRTPLAPSFRTKKIEDIKENLSKLAAEFKRTSKKTIQLSVWSNRHATIDDVYTIEDLVSILEDVDDYNLRIEGTILGIFFNNESLIDRISNVSGINVREISKPKTDKIRDFLLKNPTAVVKPECSHRYKVHLKGLGANGTSFKDWAKNYSKIRLVNSNNYKFESYFYVEDDRTLTVCRLYLNDRIRKVEELYKESEI